jgi:hypothetical protein
MGTLSPNPWDLSLSRQNGCGTGRLVPPAIPALDRRSGRIPALPCPPSRSRQYKTLWARLRKNVCYNDYRWVINTLVLAQPRWPVLKWPRMAGFQVAAEGDTLSTSDLLKIKDM